MMEFVYTLRYAAVTASIILAMEVAADNLHISYYSATAPLWGYLSFLGVLLLAGRAMRNYVLNHMPDKARPTGSYADNLVESGLTGYVVANTADEGLDNFISHLSDKGLEEFEKALNNMVQEEELLREEAAGLADS